MKEIRKIISVYKELDPGRDKIALASVVNVEESSYRRIGARMLVKSNGEWTGGISGGCLEGDALRRAQEAIYKNKPSIVTYDTLEDDPNQIGVGLGCNGKIDILFTPIDLGNKKNEIEELIRINASDKASILLKIIEASIPDEYLGKTKFADDDLMKNGFCWIDSNTILDWLDEIRSEKRNRIYSVENAKGVSLKVLAEYIRPETNLVLVGDNYDVHAFVGLAKEMGWKVSIIGRKKKLPKAVFAQVEKVYEYEEAEGVKADEFTAVVLMSHDYNWDKKMLPIFMTKPIGYLGMLGPRKRMRKMLDETGFEHLNEQDNFFSPVGLDVGAESPEEIALAIAAEILAKFRNHKGGFLKVKEGTIHSREKIYVER